ncbi:MAG: translation initiation factor IF-2 [Pseudomonadota bacterium]|nr:translation initiation factor IF-2 [Pseudomonadota bacterium]
MSQIKVFEFAKEIGLETLALMDKIREWKLPIKSHMVVLDDDLISQIKGKLAAEKESKKSKKAPVKKKAAASAKEGAQAGAPKKTAARKSSAASESAKPKAKGKIEASAKPSIVLRKKVEPVVVPVEEAIVPPEELEIATVEEIQPIATIEESPDTAPVSAVPAASVPEAIVESAETRMAPRLKKVIDVPAQPPGGIRRNIVGRMDLTKAREKEAQMRSGAQRQFAPRSGPTTGAPYRPPGVGTPRPTTGGTAGTGRPSGGPGGERSMMVMKEIRTPRSGAQRNVRAGFVATRPETEEEIKERQEKALRKKGAGSEEVLSFSSTEFRKREMVFQPKKKKGTLNREAKKTEITKPSAKKRQVKVFETIAVGDLAQSMGVKSSQLIKSLMNNGVMATENQVLDFDTVSLIVPEFGFEAQNVVLTEDELIKNAEFGNLEMAAILKAPVVTVMGHVDHGKTTLLDAIRSANVAEKEAGGITQHVGAYRVELKDGKGVTFIDTPGHEAFTEMRARGANVTDIAVIVVAADDGVMPQTAEAINHAKAAEVPIVVAVNKIDKPGADMDKLKRQLTEFQLVPEEWGGTTIFCPVSALKKQGIDELLEQLWLVAEMEDLKANPDRSAKGAVIEARMEKGRGNVATVLIQEGTLKVGDIIVCGKIAGRVRQMANDKKQIIKEAGPSVPVDIIGLDGSPSAGDKFMACVDEKSAQLLADFRRKRGEKKAIADTAPLDIEALFLQMKSAEVKELPVILKTDMTGSLEAIKNLIQKTNTEKVKIKIVHSAVGGITESDVLLALTAKGIIVGFNVRPDTTAQRIAKNKGVEVKFYNIIYEMADDLKNMMTGLLAPTVVEKTMGRAEVRNTFTVPKMGVIAGCSIVDGKVARSHQVRLLREGRVVYDGKIGSLKRFKDDVREVAQGYECGIGIENFNDIKVGDIIEAYSKEEIKSELGA